MENITTEKNYLTARNKRGFALGGLGQNLIIGLVNSYILFFYTDIFLLGAGATTILMIVARIFDALDDPIMGTIVDKTRTKWGKMRPYIMFVALPLALSTISLFIVLPSGWPQAVRIAYAFITYIVWGILYTLGDVPFWGLASAMTPNPKERVNFISASRLVHGIGSALPAVMIPLFIWLFGDMKGYTAASIVVGIVGGGMFLLAFTHTEERSVSSEKAPTLKDCLKFLVINKPLQRIVLSNVLGYTRAIVISAGLYITTYVIKSAYIPFFGTVTSTTLLNTIMVAFWGVTMYIGMIITPKLCKMFNYKKIFLITSVIASVSCVILFFIGPNFYFILAALLFSGLPYGVVTNINYVVIAESVDYVEWKTGNRAEGVIISCQTLTNKLMTALQIGTVSLSLIIIGFIQPKEIDGVNVTQAQSKFTLDGFFFLITILPAIGWLISLIPMMSFKYIGEYRENMYKELNERKAALAVAADVKDVEIVSEENAVDVNETAEEK